MDWTELIKNGITFLKKYRYTLALVLIGIVLITFPAKQQTKQPPPSAESLQATQPELEESICRILSLIDGVGKVEVLLTQAKGENIIYQTDDVVSSGTQSEDHRSDTVLLTGNERIETGLVRQIIPAVYRGAVIVCQGAGDPAVCLAVVEAVKCVTNLTSDKITVLKMK